MMEDNKVIEPVDKFWAENLLNSFIDSGLHTLISTVVLGLLEAKGGFIFYCLSARIGRHDEYRIAKINVSPKGVCEPAFFHYLKEHIEDIWMSFFDLIKENNSIRTASNLLSELASLFKSNVSRRSANEAAYVVLFHILTHINRYERVVVPKHEFSKCFG